MIQKVHVQILDDSASDITRHDRELHQPATNRFLANELKQELNSSYPSMVSVEYIDLFTQENDDYFHDITELLRKGSLHSPVILINGIPKIHGGIPPSVIKKEVEKLLFSGPVH